jgi:hypothetical protein
MDYIIKFIDQTAEGYSELKFGDLILTNSTASEISFLPNVGWEDSSFVEAFVNVNSISNNLSLMGIQAASNSSIQDKGYDLLPYTGNDDLSLLGVDLDEIKSQLELFTYTDLNTEESSLVIEYLSGIDHSAIITLSNLINTYSTNDMWIILRPTNLANN